MEAKKIAIIGAGNMGSAILEGLLKTGSVKAENMFITDQRKEPLDYYKAKGVGTSMDNVEAVNFADVLILAVKPFLVKTVLDGIKHKFDPSKQMLISIAAGVSIADIHSIVGKMPILRAMPNTAIAIQESMTCLAEANTNKEQQDWALDMFGSLGKATFIPEDLMNAATVIGSCGTAFALRFIRASIEGGVEIGFKPEIAQQIIAQTALGAAKLLLTNNSHPEAEIDKVTTPKGITIVGLNEMEKHGFSSSIIQGEIAAYNKMAK